MPKTGKLFDIAIFCLCRTGYQLRYIAIAVLAVNCVLHTIIFYNFQDFLAEQVVGIFFLGGVVDDHLRVPCGL